MNELRGKYVNVVLGIEEGRGMDFLQQSVYVIAHFNGRVMESDGVDPQPCPDFNTELVWETEKKVIRKVRSTNSPLRVECFSRDLHGHKECVGFTLLSLRSASIIPSNKAMEMPIKWYKLIGVPQMYKKSHPELYLSLTLRDHCLTSILPPALPNIPHPSFERIDNGHKTIIPIRFIEGGYIQIGQEEDKTDAFDLKLIVKAASNLHLLLPKDLVFAPTKDKFYMTFSMFGITINTKPFYRDFHETIVLKENVVIKLLSSFSILKLFFTQFDEVGVTFFHGNNKLGSTKISMDMLIPDIGDVEFKEKHKGSICKEEICIFNSEEVGLNLGSSNSDMQPYIHVETVLCTEKEKNVKVSEKIEQPAVPEKELKETDYINACGDQKRRTDNEQVKRVMTPIYEQEYKVESPRQIAKSPRVPETQSYSESFQQYSLDIILESLIWKRHSRENIFHVKFNHPRASTGLLIKAEIENTLGRNILLESLHCTLIYVSTSTRIADLLSAWPPKLVIDYDNGQQLSEELTLNTDLFLNCDVKEKSYTALLKSYTGDSLADVKVWMCLKDCGLKPLPKMNYELTPQILDDGIIIKELCEIEQWKDEIKAKFEVELKSKEKMQLNNLTANWTERKNTLEKKLVKNVNRCKNMSRELQKATSALKVQQALLEKQKALTFEGIHDEIRKNAIKYSICDNYDLIEKISTLEKENEFLKDMLGEQTQEINSIKKYSLSNEQTANLLQEVRSLEEKLVQAQKMKAYFKEQYARAVKEVHDLKTDGQKTIQNQLQMKKEELSQLSLDKFFDMQNSDAYEFSEDVLNSDLLGDGDFDEFNSNNYNTGYNFIRDTQ